MAEYNGILPKTPQGGGGKISEINTPKQDAKHPCPFHMRVPPPGVEIMSQVCLMTFVTGLSQVEIFN